VGTRKHEKQRNVGDGGEVGTLRVEVVNSKDDRLKAVAKSKGKVNEEVGCVLFRSSIKPKVRLFRSIELCLESRASCSANGCCVFNQ